MTRAGGAGQGAGDFLRRTRPARHSASEDGVDAPAAHRAAGSPSAGAAPAAAMVLADRPTSAKGSGPFISRRQVEGRPVSACSSATAARPRARLQRAMGGAEARRHGAMAAPCAPPNFASRRTADDGRNRRASPDVSTQGARQRRFPGRRQGTPSPRGQPRPGATLDIFDSDAKPLLGLHLEAVLGKASAAR